MLKLDNKNHPSGVILEDCKVKIFELCVIRSWFRPRVVMALLPEWSLTVFRG